jgi:phosphoribosylformylglycinamidine synthase PurS subunit
VPRVVVDVTLKPEILDPQGQAILGALGRLGYTGVTAVRQGKHFELDVADNTDESVVARIAETLLANPVIEDFTIRPTD